MNLIDMTTPTGDKPRQVNRRILKLRGGAFGKLAQTDPVEYEAFQIAARQPHGNKTHGTKKG